MLFRSMHYCDSAIEIKSLPLANFVSFILHIVYIVHSYLAVAYFQSKEGDSSRATCSICNADLSCGGKDPKQYTSPLLKHFL